MTNDDRSARDQLAARARERLRASLEREAAALGTEDGAIRGDLEAFLARLGAAEGERAS